jgi:hypothetical protein
VKKEMSKATEQKLWIVVKEGTIDAFKSLKDAISKFDNLATYVATESQITCLTYNPKGKPDPEKGEAPIWSIEQVPLKEIATRMLEKMK